MRKNTVAPKKPSATNAKLRASTSPTLGEDAILSTIKEETTEDDFSKVPEVQGSSDTATLTMDNMEPESLITHITYELVIHLSSECLFDIKAYFHCFLGKLANFNAILDGEFVSVSSCYGFFTEAINYVLELYLGHQDNIVVLVVQRRVTMHVARGHVSLVYFVIICLCSTVSMASRFKFLNFRGTHLPSKDSSM
jgi:hypothetical protein